MQNIFNLLYQGCYLLVLDSTFIYLYIHNQLINRMTDSIQYVQLGIQRYIYLEYEDMYSIYYM